MTLLREYVLFSIDGAEIPETDDREAAMVRGRYIAAFMDAMRKVCRIEQCYGTYKGEAENSFLVSRDDFDDYIRDTHWFEDQESILILHTFGRHNDLLETGILYDACGATLYFINDDGSTRNVKGVMRQVPSLVEVTDGDYTYLPSKNTYYQFQENDL